MEGFTFSHGLTVRVADLNYGGHVGNSRVLDYFQEARVAFLKQLGSYSELDIGGVGMILPEAHVVYRAEMFLDDELLVGVRPAALKKSSFGLEYRIERDAEVTAEGTTALVAFDYQRRKPVRLPAGFYQALVEAGA